MTTAPPREPASAASANPPTIVPVSSDNTVATDTSSITASVYGRTVCGGGRGGRERGRGRGRSSRGGGGGRGSGSEQQPAQRDTLPRGATPEVITLLHLSERPKKDQFLVFQQDLEQYVIKTFTYPEDVVKLVRDMTDPLTELIKDIPRKQDLDDEFGLTTLSETKKAAFTEPINDLYTQNIKLFAVRRQGVKHNMIKLYGVIWGNCSHPLQT